MIRAKFCRDRGVRALLYPEYEIQAPGAGERSDARRLRCLRQKTGKRLPEPCNAVL